MISDLVFGSAIRRVPDPTGKKLYLTFDDGPDPRGTPRVLDALSEFGASATFFLVGSRARENPGLVSEIVARGHSVGNHSPDHRYEVFFAGAEKLRAWIDEGEKMISEITGEPTVGFRPPAGVRNPHLRKATESLGTPMILWQTRFFDSLLPLSLKRMTASLDRANGGDIVLLHDSQREKNLEGFLNSLRAYLAEGKMRSYQFAPLRRALFS